jgi:cytochrome c-type biogenesis protein CcmH/NrfG
MKPAHFDRLRQLIQKGECVLYLGAGVSIDSGAPSGKTLAQELKAAFLPADPDHYDLGGIAELIDAVAGRRALNEWLIERFQSLRPKGALLSIPHFRWKGIYTVNFDLLLELAYDQIADAQQHIHPFYSDKDPLSRRRPNEVPLYKLHGCLSRAYSEDGRLVLTQDDFARVHESRKRLLNRLVDDMSDYTIFYVGFGRQDQDFRRALRDVEQAAGELTDLRRSYALQPGFTEAQLALWEGKRVSLIDISAADFFTLLEDTLPVAERFVPDAPQRADERPTLLGSKLKVTTEIVSDVERNFEIVDERVKLQEANVSEFFSGARPSWGAVAANADAPRDVKDDLLAAIIQDPHLDWSGVQFVLLHAEAGSGKTTLLRRIGVDLALTWERIVVSLKPFGNLEFLPLERLANATEERIYVLVDDATSSARDLSNLLTAARRAKSIITVVATARTNEWREAQADYALPVTEEFELQRLSRNEIDAIIETLTKHDALGLLAGFTHEAKVAAFETRANKQLLVALREATEGKNFDEIVVDEYDRIPSPDGQRAYLLVASLHRLGILTRAGLLHRALNIPLNELGGRVIEPTTKIIVAEEPLGELDIYYTTRHPLIAEIVFDRKLISDRRRLEYYEDLIKHLDLGYDSDRDAYRKLTRSKNKQLLRDFAEVSSRRELMHHLLQLDPSDAFAYQHAAMMELDDGNVDAAAKYLRHAISLLPQDASIRDTEGRLAMLSATQEINPVLADEKFARAEEIFRRNIVRRPDEPYSYRHLAETYVKWSDCKDQLEEQAKYISLAYSALLDGLDQCGSNVMLLQYQAELEQKVLGNPDKARSIFTEILREKPGDVVSRFLAARLEERQGRQAKALEILLEGLDAGVIDLRLQFRIAALMAAEQPELDAEIRSHFEAAMLGPVRDYRPRLTYAAYLFSQRDFEKAAQQFAKLDELIVSNRERFDHRQFDFGFLKERQTGRIRHLSYGYSSVEFGQGATEIFFSLRYAPEPIAQALWVGRQVSFDIRFNLKGPVAINLRLVDPPREGQSTIDQQLELFSGRNGRRR